MCCGAVQQESSAVVLFGTIDVRWYWRGKENEKYWGSFWLTNVDHRLQINKIATINSDSYFPASSVSMSRSTVFEIFVSDKKLIHKLQ